MVSKSRMRDEGNGASRSAQSGNPRFARHEPDERRRQILEGARRCLAAKGVAGATVAAIAKEAKSSNGLINHYFDSKDALLIAVYETEAGRLAAATRAALKAGRHDPADRLRALIDTAFAPAVFNGETLAVWLALWGLVRTNASLRRAHAAFYAGYRASLVKALDEVAAARALTLDSRALALSLTALTDGLWLEWSLDPSVFAPEDARAACYRMLRGEGIDL